MQTTTVMLYTHSLLLYIIIPLVVDIVANMSNIQLHVHIDFDQIITGIPQTFTIPHTGEDSPSSSPSSSCTTPDSIPPPPEHRQISVTPIYIPPPPKAPKRRAVPPTPPLSGNALLKPRRKRRLTPRRQNSITNALRKSYANPKNGSLRSALRSSSDTLYLLRNQSGGTRTNLLVSKSKGGGMGITLTPPTHSQLVSHHQEMSVMAPLSLHSKATKSLNNLKSNNLNNLKSTKMAMKMERRRASDPNMLMPPSISSTRSLKNRVNRVSRLRIRTYSVMYHTKVLGLEMHPFDHKSKTGALVTWCHNAFSQENVSLNSMVVGVQNQLVMDMDHDEILQLIRNSDRPLLLTFHNRIYRTDMDIGESQSLSTWRDRDGKIRFRSN